MRVRFQRGPPEASPDSTESIKQTVNNPEQERWLRWASRAAGRRCLYSGLRKLLSLLASRITWCSDQCWSNSDGGTLRGQDKRQDMRSPQASTG